MIDLKKGLGIKLAAFIIFHGLVALLLCIPGLEADSFLAFLKEGKIPLGSTAAIGVLSATVPRLLPDHVKASLVFLRIADPLPGCRAFSEHMATDPRIDTAALKRQVGVPLPSNPREQNALWYKLYKSVSEHKSVQDAHRSYLALRDLSVACAVMVVPLSIVVLLTTTFAISGVLFALAVLGEFWLLRTAASNVGIRFVTNVLADVAAGSNE